MLLPGLAILAQHRLDVSEKSGRLFKGLSLASSSLRLQRVSPERAYGTTLGFAMQKQSFGISAVWRTVLSGQINGIVLDPPHSARSFLPSATAALGAPMEQRDHLGGWSAQGSDSYTRVTGRMITSLQKLVIIARQASSEDSFAEAETAKPFDDHLCSMGYSTEDRAKCFKGLERSIPQEPHQELEGLRLEKKANHQGQQMLNQSPRGKKKYRSVRMRRETNVSTARTQSQSHWVQTPRRRGIEHALSFIQKGYYISTSGRNSTRVLHRLCACYMVPGQLPKQGDLDCICKLCSRQRGRCRTRRLRRDADIIVK